MDISITIIKNLFFSLRYSIGNLELSNSSKAGIQRLGLIKMDIKQAEELLQKYKSGNATAEEKAWVETWYMRFNDKATQVPYDLIQADRKASWAIFEKEYQQSKVYRLWPRIAAAASIVIALSAGLWFYSSNDSAGDRLYVNDVAPGQSGATLILANGKQIRLSTASNGELAREAGISISKSANGQLVYEIKETRKTNNQSNTLSTAKGETYQVRLPDGSLVYLNAASSLTYSAALIEHGVRRVSLEGEAYFEVAKDKQHPFHVITNGQDVEVLGTHFNINSYTDEISIKTTLLEGSVKVTTLLPLHPASLAPSGRGGKAGEGGGNSSLPTGLSPLRGERGLSTILKPGQQSTLTNSKINVKEVDAEEAIAWKSGMFTFASEPLEEIMRKVARWYNVEVTYEQNSIKRELFSGSVSKFDHVSVLLRQLENTGPVKFKIEGKKITVCGN